MLKFQNVSKKYGNYAALTGIDLEMETGIYGFLSPNGAGKTTLLKLAATLLFPSSGKIYYEGEDIFAMGERFRERLGYMPQNFGYYREKTAVQYLQYIAALKGLERKKAQDKIEEVLELVALTEVKDKKMKKYSGGMLQRAGIAQALLNDPEILLLDEPTAGLDPKERARFRKLLSNISKGKTILYSTHIVSDIENIASQIIMLREQTVYCKDEVEMIVEQLAGKVFTAVMTQEECDDFAENYFVISQKPEGKKLKVRFVAEEMQEGWEPQSPELEDVFLWIYR